MAKIVLCTLTLVFCNVGYREVPFRLGLGSTNLIFLTPMIFYNLHKNCLSHDKLINFYLELKIKPSSTVGPKALMGPSSAWKVLSFPGVKSRDFRDFWTFPQKFVPAKSLKTTKSRNQTIEKLNTCRVRDFIFPNIWSKYDIDTLISHTSTYSNKIRVSVTYLIKIALISNRKIDIQWDFRFSLLLKSRN